MTNICRQLSERAGRAWTLLTHPFPVGLPYKLSRWVCQSFVRILRTLNTSHTFFCIKIGLLEVSLFFCRYDHSSSVEVLRPSVSPQVSNNSPCQYCWLFFFVIPATKETYSWFQYLLFILHFSYLQLHCPSPRTLCSGEGCTAALKLELSRGNRS